jgi:hypothetical protein
VNDKMSLNPIRTRLNFPSQVSSNPASKPDIREINMATALHTEIKSLAGANPAAYLSIELLNTLTIRRFLIAINKITGAEIPAGGSKRPLSASLDSATFKTPPLSSARLTKYSSDPHQIGLELNSELTVTVKVFVKGDKTKLVSTVTVVVSDLMILGTYSRNTVSFEGLNSTAVSVVTRDKDADKVLASAGIDPLEAARVEGLIAYSAINSSINAFLAQRQEVSLSDLFPSFDFGTAANLVPLDSGRSLGIIPSEFTGVESAACRCASGSDLGVSQSSNTITVPSNPKAGTVLGGVVIGGPVAEKVDPLRDLGRRYEGSGAAGVYLPKVAYSGLTVQAMPAISVKASDNGFIGFDADATVGFSGIAVSLDAKNGGVIVSVNMDIEVHATCTLDMGCGIRLPIGYAIINPVSGSNANLKMGFYPTVDQSGTVKLKGVLQYVDMGTFVAVIVGVGTALEIIGVTAWIGFLIDVVLSAIVSHNLPSILRDEVKKYLGQNEWILLHLGDMLKATYPGPTAMAATFDVDVDSLLASIALDR